MLADQSTSSINNATPLVEEDMSSALATRGTYQSGRKFQTEHADAPLPKRTRSPTIPSTNGGFPQNPAIVSDSHKRYKTNLNLKDLFNFPFSQSA